MQKSFKLAEEIYEIEHADYKTRKEWLDNGVTSWTLSGNVTLQRSDDYLMWYLWKAFPGHEDSFFKAVPMMGYDKKRIREILDAQLWECI